MMCGITAIFGQADGACRLEAMNKSQHHRGPDSVGTYASSAGRDFIGHVRLSIIDLSDAGRQPMSDPTGRYWIAFNGEIYNYLELKAELNGSYPFSTGTDTEVLMAAWLLWGKACLDRLIGMFAFVLWDDVEQTMFGARDRFGVKPLHYYQAAGGALWIASEIKSLHAAGVPKVPNAATWATYLATGMHDYGPATFWEGIQRVPPGSLIRWSPGGGFSVEAWYDVANAAMERGADVRSDSEVADELVALLEESVRLRFRADVPVGICLSGGLDSSLLLELVHRIQGKDSAVKTFTFHCGDSTYDEVPWVQKMLAQTRHPASFCLLSAQEVPALAARVASFQDEPYGGLPTLGMAKIHERAGTEGVVVLLDGNGLDEGWAGYEYYEHASSVEAHQAPVQGSRDRATLPECLKPEFRSLAEKLCLGNPFPDPLRFLQYRDIRAAKIPKAMRFADRVSMMFSRELREPFLDHRVIELGLRQPAERKVRGGQGKWLVRRIGERLLPNRIWDAPKRPVQTPQREWLRGPLRPWLFDNVERALAVHPDWFDASSVRAALDAFLAGRGDNSFYVWQWISTGMLF